MQDNDQSTDPIWGVSDSVASPEVRPPATKTRSRRRTAAAAIVGTLIAGGAVGAVSFTALAASPSAAPSQPSTTTGTGQTGPGGPGGFGGHNEAVSDASVVAKAIGISESTLTTALQNGQTVAAVAKAHNVAVQTVIDALVADGNDELAAAVKAGTITQAQADAQKAAVVQRATDQVNGTLMGGPGGFGGHGAPNGSRTP